jgi:hypothetical protein
MDYVAPEDPPLRCIPNLDGEIDAAELAPSFGSEARFLVSPAGGTRTVDLGGAVDADGRRVWDWSSAPTDDQMATFSAAPLDGRWYAESFPEGEFVSSLDAAGTTEGVYRLDDDALWLLGLASSDDAPAAGQTLFVYDRPVPIYRFPLAPGGSHIAMALVRNATFHGLPYAGTDTYEVAVAASGRLELPDLRFTQAMQVRIHTTVAPAIGAPISTRRASYVFECFGEVARATSAANEPEEDFTVAAEVRRLALGQ